MPTLLPIGMTTTMTQTIAYAMPASKVTIISSAALEFSNDLSAWTSITAATTGYINSYGFVRCTSAAPVISIKRD